MGFTVLSASTAMVVVLTSAAFTADAVLVVDDQQFEARHKAKPAVSNINGAIRSVRNSTRSLALTA